MYLHKSKIKQVTERDSWIKLAKCNIPPLPLAKKWGGKKKIFCSIRSQNLPPHFQNRGAAPGSGSSNPF